MKQKLKRLRPWLLSVTALLLLVNCAEELALPTNRSTEGDAARHKILHGREAAEKKNDLVAHLKEALKQLRENEKKNAELVESRDTLLAKTQGLLAKRFAM